MKKEEIIHRLLQSDVAIQYQVHRDLLDEDRKDLQNRILKEGKTVGGIFKQNIPGKLILIWSKPEKQVVGILYGH